MFKRYIVEWRSGCIISDRYFFTYKKALEFLSSLKVSYKRLYKKGDKRKMTIQELSDEMRKERARCSTHCGTWNSKDRDCEIYGEQHCPPSKCRYFLATELERRNKEQKRK